MKKPNDKYLEERVNKSCYINSQSQQTEDIWYQLSEETWERVDSTIRGAILGGLGGSVIANGKYAVAGAIAGTLLGGWSGYKIEREEH